ncbi:predicted protein [Postia placenta Mad-698-R]|nr:predicted protein [Postia placenta Mad-698-R]
MTKRLAKRQTNPSTSLKEGLQQRMDVFAIETTFQGWLQVLDLPRRNPAPEGAAGVTVSNSDRGTAQHALPDCVAACDGVFGEARQRTTLLHVARFLIAPSEQRQGDASQVHPLAGWQQA